MSAKRYPTIDELLEAEPETRALFERATEANNAAWRLRFERDDEEIALKFAKRSFERLNLRCLNARAEARDLDAQATAVYERVGAES